MNKLLAVVVISLYSLMGSSQEWTHYTTANTSTQLCDNHVEKILVDKDGNKWFGTWDGLSKFDGTNWTTYTTDNIYFNNNINCLAMDSLGNIWVGIGFEGVSMYDGNEWTTFTAEDGLPSAQITAIGIDNSGKKWFGSGGSGISTFNDTIWNYISGWSGIDVTAIIADDNDNVWVGTSSYGVSKFDGLNWETYTTTNGLANNKIFCIKKDHQGDLWFGTYGGVSKFDGTNWTSYNEDDGLAYNLVSSIAVDNEGNKWFGTYGGVSKFDGANWTTVKYDYTRSIYIDLENNKWIGTDWGVLKSDETYQVADGLVNNDVYSIAIDKDGNKWFATYQGISKYDNINWSIVSNPSIIKPSMIDVEIDNSNNKWFARNGGGILKFDGSNWYSYQYSFRFLDIAFDNQDNLWAATNHGVNYFNGSNWFIYTSTNGLVDNYVRSVAIDSNGHKWFGTNNGVSEFDGINWKSYTTAEGLIDNKIYSIAVDSNNIKWFATENGLSSFDGNNWANYFVGNRIDAIEIDHENNIWVAIGYPSYILQKFDGVNWKDFSNFKDENIGISINSIKADSSDIWLTTYNNGVFRLGFEYLTTSSSLLYVADTANSNVTFDIATNSSWNISSNEPWLTIDKTSGSDSATITITAVTANSKNIERTAILTISGTSINPKSITIVQAPDASSIYIDKLNISNRTYGDVPFTLYATGGDTMGEPLIFSSSNTNIISCTGIYGGNAKVLNVGSCTLYARQNGNETYDSVKLTVNPKPISITANPNQNKVYGDVDPDLAYSITPGLVTGDKINGSLSREVGEEIGEYLINQGTLTAGNNYNITFSGSTFSITKKELVVTASNMYKKEGEANPEFVYTFSGFANEDDVSALDTLPTVNCLATESSPTGEYDITLSGGSDNNYYFTYKKGTLTVLNYSDVNDNYIQDIQIHPNPFTDKVTITTYNQIPLFVEVRNILGEKVFSEHLKNNILDLSSLSNGIYFLKVNDTITKILKK